MVAGRLCCGGVGDSAESLSGDDLPFLTRCSITSTSYTKERSGFVTYMCNGNACKLNKPSSTLPYFKHRKLDRLLCRRWWNTSPITHIQACVSVPVNYGPNPCFIWVSIAASSADSTWKTVSSSTNNWLFEFVVLPLRPLRVKLIYNLC